MSKHDVVVIGGGHNGLTGAAYLAKAGKDVVVVEQRDAVGGLAGTYELAPGFRASVGPDLAGLLSSEVIAILRGRDFAFGNSISSMLHSSRWIRNSRLLPKATAHGSFAELSSIPYGLAFRVATSSRETSPELVARRPTKLPP